MLPLTTDLERAYRVGAKLLDCACAALGLTEMGCPARRCLVPGQEVAYENCCEDGGQLTVNVTSVYPSQVFPTPDGTAKNCFAPYDVISYSVKVLRCSPVGQVERDAGCAALDDAAHRVLVDLLAVRGGVACCLRDEELMNPIAGVGYRWAYGDHSTLGPEGLCTGSSLTVLVGVPTCVECGDG